MERKSAITRFDVKGNRGLRFERNGMYYADIRDFSIASNIDSMCKKIKKISSQLSVLYPAISLQLSSNPIAVQFVVDTIGFSVGSL